MMSLLPAHNAICCQRTVRVARVGPAPSGSGSDMIGTLRRLVHDRPRRSVPSAGGDPVEGHGGSRRCQIRAT